VGTLASEFGPILDESASAPRIYADANIPAGVVAYMRHTLGWDVLFVIEHDDLRRAPDGQHYRLARELRRTIVTLDRDYFDDRRFPPEESGGVIVFQAPDERALMALIARTDREVFRPAPEAVTPLSGRKLQWHVDTEFE
jgi:hypothetical protein